MSVNSIACFYSVVIKCVEHMWINSVLPSLLETADGKTTSPQSPPLPLPLHRYVHTPTISSSATSPSRSFTLDRSKSAPASISLSLPSEASFSPSQSQGNKSHLSDTQVMTKHRPASASPPVEESPQNPACGQVDGFQPQPTESPILPAQEPLSSTVSNDNKETTFVLFRKSVAESNANNGITLQEPDSQTGSQNDVCLQEVDMADPVDPTIINVHIPDNPQEKEQGNLAKDVANAPTEVSEFMDHHNLPGSSSSSKGPVVHSAFEMNMETGLFSKGEMTSERGQPESDTIPSLAQALKELHKLLMSNSNAQACAWSPLSATRTTNPRPDTEVDHNLTGKDYAGVSPNVISSSHTATTNKTMFAKSEYDTVEKDGTFEGLTVISQKQEGNQTNGFANISTQKDMTQSSEGNQVDEHGEGLMLELQEAPSTGTSQQKPLQETPSAGPSQQQPLSVAVGSLTDNSNLVPVESSYPSIQSPALAPSSLPDSIQPSTLALLGQYPAEHIQRIQAAGFSSHEAAEALEQAEGSVELALLVLLARKITVPT